MIFFVATSAMRTRLGRAVPPAAAGDVRVKASLVPSGEKEGSVSQSPAPRPSRSMAAAVVPSVSVSQIRWIRTLSTVSKRVTAMFRPFGVYVCRSVQGS